MSDDDDEMMTDDSWQLCCHYLIHLILTQINIKILWMKWVLMREKNKWEQYEKDENNVWKKLWF